MVAAGELASSTLTASRLLTLAKRSPGTRGRVKHEQHTGDGERGSSETDAHEGGGPEASGVEMSLSGARQARYEHVDQLLVRAVQILT
jgi:hypothetical protein